MEQKPEKQIWMQWRGQPSPKVTQHRTGPAGADRSRRAIGEEGVSAWLPRGAKSYWRNLFLSSSPEHSGLTLECPGGTSRTCGAEGGDGKEADKNIKGH